MNSLTIRLVATYFILLLATVGLIGLILLARGDEAQVWAALFLIIGALVRDLASIQSAQSTEKIAESAIIQETIRQDNLTGPTS